MTAWWNNNVESRIDDFKSWIGDFNQPSKIYCRDYIKNKGYKTLIDCGCGLATDYYGFKQDNYQINYTGLDSCKYLLKQHQDSGINIIEAELENNLPIIDNIYECVYCREVLEHLSYYELSVNEMIRIASKEVILVFFLCPHEEEDKINYWESEDLYHNQYNKIKLENFILNNNKVKDIFWIDKNDINYNKNDNLNVKKQIMHILLKN